MTKFKVKMRDEKKLMDLTGYPELLKTLFYNRGIKTVSEAESFLQPNYEEGLHNPFLLPDMEKAVGRILLALEKKEKIVIFSDYDADGIPGGVILHDFFKKINHINFVNYIPHRHLEGFGLNHEAIDKFKADGVKLIITVDCGIADLAEAEEIKKHEIDLIITDHHLPVSAGLPKALAVVDAKRLDSKYPFKDLCGAGVAFKLVQAILINLKEEKNPLRLTKTNRSEEISLLSNLEIKEGWEKWLLDMVGIATLSDMVPLIGENRILAFYGLKVLQKTRRLGLIKLCRLLKIEQKNLTEDDVGFSISPRINAASRMGNPDDAFNLFIAETDERADISARHLDKINNERKGVVASLVKEIKKIMRERYGEDEGGKACPNLSQRRVLVIGNPDWKPSLLGLVANSLKDDHRCPVFLWGRDGGDILKGSCRSDGRVSLIELMNTVESGIFEEFGGHIMSGGFSVFQNKIHLLEEKLQLAYDKLTAVGDFVSEELMIDMKISLDDVNLENFNLLKKLAPFGVGNPKPLFLFEKVIIDNIKMFGKEVNHLEIIFKNSRGRNIKAIGFFMKTDNWGQEIKAGDRINLLANFEHSTFRGFIELRLRIIDLEFVL
jgi:single-stranded-DNA-specific exonuclease